MARAPSPAREARALPRIIATALAFSFGAERNNRIDAGRAPGGDPGRDEGHARNENDNPDKGAGVGRAHAEEETVQEPGGGKRSEDSRGHTDRHDRHGLSNDQAKDGVFS